MLVAALLLVTAGAITLWMAGAIYFDLCEEGRYAGLTVAAWLAGIILLFVTWQPLWQPFVGLLAVAAPFLIWWLRQKPSHHRDWDTSVAVLPRATRTDDVVTIENVRNFDYPAPGEFTTGYDLRTFHLTNLQSGDIIFFNWGSRFMSHPVMVLDFGPDGRLCISIEVRYRKGQKYSVLRSLYRRQELIFLAADERDVILRRVKYVRNQEGRMYNLHASPEELRTVFLDYVEAINSLYAAPRWYHGLCANCTTSFFRLPNSRFPLDWRVLANARLDRALYESGRLDRTLPLMELRRIAYVNDIANEAPRQGFGEYVRRELEKRRGGG